MRKNKKKQDEGWNPKWDLLVKNNDGSKGSKGSRDSKNSLQQEDSEASLFKKISKGGVDIKRNWIKATYNRVTKRLYCVSSDLEELKILLWMRFGGLRDNFQDPGALQVFAELPRPANLGVESESANELAMTCSEDLDSFIYQTYQQRGVCPRLIVKVDVETAVRKSVPRNVVTKSARVKQTESDASSIQE